MNSDRNPSFSSLLEGLQDVADALRNIRRPDDPKYRADIYRLSSVNRYTAKISSDGRFRAVIALTDSGVPNWLHPAGYKDGGIYGRWFDCDSALMPIIKRVKRTSLRDHRPPDTPIMRPAERDEELRVRACQRRHRW